MTGTVLIWDDDRPPPPGEETLILWSSFDAGGRAAVSLPRLVEDQAAPLRARYLAWVHDLGERVIRGRRVVEQLELAPGFSYWWMTLLSHAPNYYESAHITDVIKCLAFETFCEARPVPAVIRLRSARAGLGVIFESYCAGRGIRFERDAPPDDPRTAPAAPAATLPGVRPWMRTLATLLPRRRRRARLPDALPGGVCVFDMLVHLEPGSIETGVFHSQYWTRLVPLLEARAHQTTWMHTFFRHRDVPSVADAAAVLERFNAAAGGRHILLDTQRDLRTVAAAVRLYLRLVVGALRLRSIRHGFRPAGSAFDFWPLYRANWHASLVGPYAIRNCLNLALFARVLKRLPRQSLGVYIQENQPWEMALIEGWRAAGHGTIVGVPHTTVRFWDLRYFHDRRAYGARDAAHVPQPDVVAVNGPAMREAFVEGGGPPEAILEVEALRFLHLRTSGAGARAAGPLRVLICGDNTPGSNEKMLGMVAEASRHLPADTRYVFKPHKAAPLDAAMRAGFPLEVRDGSLAEMLPAHDIALTGHVTSAAVDAYGLGVPVASLLDGRSLNGSPLRGRPGVRYFSNAAELIDILRHPGEGTPRDDLFALDPDLPRWRALLTRFLESAPETRAPSVRSSPGRVA